jgi:ribosomal 50S subunit-associated protein YjgA (DUF615 family)
VVLSRQIDFIGGLLMRKKGRELIPSSVDKVRGRTNWRLKIVTFQCSAFAAS